MARRPPEQLICDWRGHEEVLNAVVFAIKDEARRGNLNFAQWSSMRRSVRLIIASVFILGAIAVLNAQLPAWAAGGLLYPTRQHVERQAPESCEDVTFDGRD